MKRITLFVCTMMFLASSACFAAVQGDVDSNNALDIAKGGTNGTTAGSARANLSLDKDDTVAFGTVQVGEASVATGLLQFYNSSKAYPFGLFGLGADAPGVGWRFPSAMPAGTYLITADVNGYLDYLDPSTLGSNNLGVATGADVGALFSGTGDYLKSDGTTDSPTYVSFDSDQFNETGDGTVASPKVISIEPTILGSGSITEITGTVYENQPSNPGDLFWNDSGVYLRNNTKLVTLATTTDNLPTGDFTAPTIAPAFSSIGELAMTASETSTIDCTKFTANCTTAGAIAFTGNGPCIADPPVYGGDTCSGADAGGTAEDLAGNLSVAGAVAVDNTANTTIAPEINFVSDNFDRPDSSTLGENWTTINELTALKIVNGAAVSGGPTALSAAVYNANLANNQKVCATVNGLNYGVIARSSIETPTYYYASFSAGSVSIKIRRSGTATTLATLGSGFTEFPYTLCLSASGSTETVLTASVDGANQLPFTHTDNPLISGGLGIMGYQQASSIDNFTGEGL